MHTEWSSQWSSDDPHARLAIPKPLLDRQRYRFVTTKEVGLRGSCAEFEILLHGVKLTECLIDTSQRYEAITLKQRITYRREIVLAHTPVVIFPFNDDEIAVPPTDGELR